MTRSELRAAAVTRSGGTCEWSRCVDRGEQLAHIRGIGRGGNPDGTRDRLSNVAFLCRYHHDVLDGRTRMKLWEVESLLEELITRRHPPTHVPGFPFDGTDSPKGQP